MKMFFTLLIVFGFIFSSLAYSHCGVCGVGEKAAKTGEVINTVCPVMEGGVVSKDTKHKTVYKGKTIGFCCSGCVGEFKKDPEKYMAKIEKSNVEFISYDQFVKIRNSGEKYILVDVLSAESYNDGHIEGAASFPFETINEETAKAKLDKGSKIIVYCASFQCHASTKATEVLLGLGYKAVDYKGGLEEWKEKGNKLVSKVSD